MQILAFVIATAIPLLSLYLIYRLDLYKTGAFRTILTCFISGAVAFWIASLVNRTIYDRGWLGVTDIIRYSAPLVEEILKGMLLWYLVRRPTFTYFVEGAVYCFAAGVGFAIFENYQYILDAGAAASFGVAISRVISTNLMHATTTSLLGIALGYARFERVYRQILLSLAGLLVAILVHMGFNNLVTRVDGSLLLVYAAASGLAGTGLIAFA